MRTQEQQIEDKIEDKLELLISIQDNIEYYKHKIARENYAKAFEVHQFPNLIAKCDYNIEIYTKCIERFKLRFNNHLNETP